MSIPKLIHLCWLGIPNSNKTIDQCLATHAKLVEAGYEIKVWNEENYDLNISPAVADAYKYQKWALVSDYIRLDLLNKYGGIYIDTDIQILRPFDDLLEFDFFIGFMWDCTLGTAVIGATQGHKVIQGLKNIYDRDSRNLVSPNNDTFTDYFLKNIPRFVLNGKSQLIDRMLVLDKNFFEHPPLLNNKNHTIHHFKQSWKPNSKIKTLIKRLVISVISLKIYRIYVCRNSRRVSKYYPIFREHCYKNYNPMPDRSRPRLK